MTEINALTTGGKLVVLTVGSLDHWAWSMQRSEPERTTTIHVVNALTKAEAVEQAVDAACNGQAWKYGKQTKVEDEGAGWWRVAVSIKRKAGGW